MESTVLPSVTSISSRLSRSKRNTEMRPVRVPQKSLDATPAGSVCRQRQARPAKPTELVLPRTASAPASPHAAHERLMLPSGHASGPVARTRQRKNRVCVAPVRGAARSTQNKSPHRKQHRNIERNSCAAPPSPRTARHRRSGSLFGHRRAKIQGSFLFIDPFINNWSFAAISSCPN